MGRAVDPRGPPGRQAARGGPPGRRPDRGQAPADRWRRTPGGPPQPGGRGPARRGGGAATPGEAAQLLEEGRSGSDEDELAASVVAWGCWSGSVGFLLAMAVVSSAAILALRTGHLRLQPWGQGAMVPAEPRAVLSESLRPECAATRLPSQDLEGGRGGQRIPQVLRSDSCCKLCQAASDCEAWAWSGQGERQGCWLVAEGHPASGGEAQGRGEGSEDEEGEDGAAAAPAGGEGAEDAAEEEEEQEEEEEEEEEEDTPRSWEDIDEAAEASAGAEEEGEDDGDQATKVFAEAGKGNVLFEADGGESVPVLLEADGAQEHTSRTKHDDDEAPEALPEAKEKNAKMDVKGAEDGNGDRPDDEEEQEEEEEEEAPLPGTSYPNTPAWRSPWSTASVKEEGKDEEEHGAGAPKQHDRQEKHGEAQKKHEKERHEDPPPPGCDADDHLPEMWAHQGGKEAVFKVLTYNLFWWSLFGERDGDHDKAAHLIEKAAKSRAFDLMGFQECEDVARVLEPAGLKDKYYVFSGSGKTEAICIAASKASFDLLSHGMQAVGEDSKEQYFGKRSAQWMRLNHKKTGQKVFFMNHHGPLPVDSGGKCGGRATARALLQLTSAEAERGDAVIMVGDFNAGDGSTTVESLEKRLHRVYHGVADGGIDNFFSNLGTDSVRKAENLGSGGSDHDALSVELQVGGGAGEAPPPGEDEEADGEDELPPARPEGEGQPGGEAAPEAAAEGEGPEDEKDDRPSRCGLSDEGGVAYSGLAGEEVDGVGSPADCCTTCSGSSTCKSWTWTGRSGAGVCSLWFGLPAQREKKEGFISGLPPRKARLDFKRS